MERRLSPRIGVSLPIDIRLIDGQTLTVESVDLSYVGVSFNCNYQQMRQIFPAAQWLAPKDQVSLSISLKLSDELVLVCKCTVSRFLRLSENQYHIGVQFLDIDEDTQRGLIRFVNSHRDSSV